MVNQLGEFSPLPALAVGILGMIFLILAVSLGILNENSIFPAIAFIMLLVATLTFLSVHSAVSEPEKCKFESGE